MKRLTQEQKQEIIRLRVEENVPAKAVAEKFHITKGAVFNIVSAWKKHGDSAMTDDEIRDELDRKAVDDAADDDYVCYEVTGDTDIEAYMADRNVKEPDTAATVTDSEQEDCVEVPADIVSQETENVKADDDLIPCAVVNAVANEMDRLHDTISQCDRTVREIQRARANAENDLNELKTFLNKNGYGDVVKALDSGAKWRALQGEK